MQLVCREDVALTHYDGQVVLELAAPVSEMFLEIGAVCQILLELCVFLPDRILQFLVYLAFDVVLI